MERELKFPNYVALARARDAAGQRSFECPLSRRLRAADKRQLLAEAVWKLILLAT
jgi:hypothetical protein